MSGLATVDEEDVDDVDEMMVKRSDCVWLSHGRRE